MARIFKTVKGQRRTIKLSTDDILSVVREYQRVVRGGLNYEEVRNHLENIVMYLPEDV